MNDERQNKSEEQEGERSQKLKSKCAQKKCQKDSADVALLHYTTTDYFCENDSFLLMLTLRKYKHRKGSCS